MRFRKIGRYTTVKLLFCLAAVFSKCCANEIKQNEFDAEICDGILCGFQHMEFNSGSDKLYIGAINRIYQFDLDLKQEETAKTGPVLDSDTCYPHSSSKCSDLRETNNINKLLKIDVDNDRIVACGTVKQGVCDLRKLSNVSKLLNDFSRRASDPRNNDFVATTKPDQTTVAFIGKEGRDGQEQSLYVGSSKTKHDTKLLSDDEHFPTFTSRKMPHSNMASTMLSSDKESFGLLTKKDLAANGFRVNFISAFEGNLNGYFVLTYPKIRNKVADGNDIRSYVAQVCMRGDDGKSTTNSYFEVPITSLSWLGGEQHVLKRVISSTTAKVGYDLQQSLGIPNTIGSVNPDVLFAAFATEGEYIGGSTLAMFPLYELDEFYFKIVQACLNGYQMNHIEWQRESEIQCKKINFPLAKPLCTNTQIWDIVGLFQSNETMRGYTVFESNNTVVTSVAVTKTGLHTVVFMGTKDGRLLKLRVDAKPSGRRLLQPYEEIRIDSHKNSIQWQNLGSPAILSDMRLDNDLTRLYVMSERKLMSLPLHDCSKFKTCFECLSAGDPFCGWCTLENKCTAESICPKGENSYATSDPSNCPRLTDVSPPALAATADSVTVTVDISNIPREKSGGKYYCVYGGGRTQRVAKYMDTFITCLSPPRTEVPELKGKEVSVPLSLSYRTDDRSSTIIASTEIVFYDCNNFKSCLPCLGSREFNCHWCGVENSCKEIGFPCRITHAEGDIRNAGRCPVMRSVIEPPHIHHNQLKSVKVAVDNLDVIIGDKFSCKFTIGEKSRTVNASKANGNIICGPVKGFLPADKYEADAKISLFWKKNFIIDNPDDLNVTMYRCARGPEDNCGKCLQLSNDLKCGWCENKEKCTLCTDCLSASSCPNDRTKDVYDGWLDEAQVCPNPQITEFSPMSATPGGMTTVTVKGINLGKVFVQGQIRVNITVAGHQCEVLREGFKESEQIKCLVKNVRSPTNGPVTFCLLNHLGECRGTGFQDVSTQIFHFVKPELYSFTPQEGLESGGSIITLSGNNLNIGNGVTVLIGGRNCAVEGDVTSTEFKCKLACDSSTRRSRRHTAWFTHANHARNGRHALRRYLRNEHLRRRRTRRDLIDASVKLGFDDKMEYYDETFRFEMDLPKSKDIKFNRRESIRNGGMNLTISGNNLHHTKNLTLEVSYEGQIRSKKCKEPGLDKDIRYCFTPALDGYPSGNYTAKLIFDDCLVLNDIGFIRYTENPFLNEFDEPDGVKHNNGGPIIITGTNLCPNPLNCDESSARVQIGKDYKCNITDLDKDKVVCVPPDGASGKHGVMVYIGGYNQSVGEIQFESGFPTLVIILVTVGAVILIIIIVTVCVRNKRTSKELQEVRQRQNEYDIMEAKVAKECKEAFAELQVDMQSDLDNMGQVGIPFRPRSEYIMRVLFPEPEMYEKINSQAKSTPHVDSSNRYMHNGRGAPHRTLSSALDDFDKLLENKVFLLNFIYTLENQKRFSMKDRSNVAGLLMIALQDRLQYATDILQELLTELIRDVMESKNNPRLLLRRSESVAEKMLTHWFSILLHGFLQECAGEPLFTLYRAIRAQLDKGPVDAITGFAKYSLNQDKLLRQAVSYEQLVLTVVDNDDPNKPGFSVKVLDCDTVTQTKEKIIALKYRNQPQSAHPSPDVFDLFVHREPPISQAILSDEDNTSAIEGNWRRLNTLLHYKVKDHDVVSMVPKKATSILNQSMNSNHSFGSRVGGMRYNGSGQRLINNDGAGSLPRHLTSTQGSRSTTPTLMDDGKKTYHLMKYHDNEPRDGGADGSMMVSEIYLTRLLATKGTVQKFVDDLFETIFSVVQRGHALPLAIKHMFDFFDEQADFWNIRDPDVVHTWKSNSLPLRFWVNLIKNPEFLFDIKKSGLVDSCLSVIAGTFMDSCSTTDQNLGKDSATGKLLYAKDVQNYRKWVANYYDEISGMDQLSASDMKCFLRDESRAHSRNSAFAQAALTELYHYVQRFNTEVIETLNQDYTARNQGLAQRLERLTATMTSTV